MTPPAKTSRSRGPAARSGQNGRPKDIEFRGLKLKAPSKPPGDLAFSLADNETGIALREIFGAEQFRKIRQKCATDGKPFDANVRDLDDLVVRCFNELWGSDAGE